MVIALLILTNTVAWATIAPARQDWDGYLQQQFTSLQSVHAGVVAAPLSAPRKPLNMTILLLQARDHWLELSTTTRNLIAPWLLRPTASGGDGSLTLDPAKTEVIDTAAHFRIHYIDAAKYPGDANAATLSYINSVSNVLESVWSVEHTTLGYDPVQSDVGLAVDGGDNARYDVFLGDVGAGGIYGYVFFDEFYNTDVTRPNGTATYMVLDNDYLPAQYGYANYLDPLRVTVAHEYFHAIQMSYDWQEQRAFMESCSTWMEEKVYPAIHDNYQYIGEPYTDSNDNGYYDDGEPFIDYLSNGQRDTGSVDYPELPLDSMNNMPPHGMEQYGRFLWVRFLDEVYGSDIIRQIWDAATSTDLTFTVEDMVLRGHGASLATAYQSYAEWGYDTAQFSIDSNHPYPPPRVWMEAVQGAAASFSSATSPSLVALNSAGFSAQMHLSSIYLQINTPSGAYTFNSVGGAPAVTMLVDSGSGPLLPTRLTLAAGSGSWSAPAGTVKAVAVVSNTSASADGMCWSLASGSGSTPDCQVTSPPAMDGGGGGGGLGLATLWLLAVGRLLLRRLWCPFRA